ncbi:hypothetical protein [Mycetocola reblochoni]|uniref:Uncharacterized protein n=1 Tax=Mycetocola reblochoni TaxID=331618 RepID=A0A3L6ZTY1_9MICO|nr:hypothetical protein [Mycetocola reblochoni]RLP71259.1 hypothetical protein D9V30_02275 [Mycetocola reblochoni]
MYAFIRDGDESIELHCAILSTVADYRMYAFRPDGRITTNRGRVDDRAADRTIATPARALRELMFEPGKGTWFSAVVTVTAEGRASVSYNYDDEPQLSVPFDPVAYKIDFEKFPRDEAHTPEWLRQRLAEAVELNKKRAALPRDQWFD